MRDDRPAPPPDAPRLAGASPQGGQTTRPSPWVEAADAGAPGLLDRDGTLGAGRPGRRLPWSVLRAWHQARPLLELFSSVCSGEAPSRRAASAACMAAQQRASSNTSGRSTIPMATVMPASPNVSTVKRPRLVTPYCSRGCATAQYQTGIDT